MTTLVGTDYTYGGGFVGTETLTNGLKFWKFTASASGQINFIELYAQTSPSLTGMNMAIFSDGGGIPGNLLGWNAVFPSDISNVAFVPWYMGSLMSPVVTVIAGVDYWLAVEVMGTLVYEIAVSSGGTQAIVSSGTITDSPAGGLGASSFVGPIVFWGEGELFGPIGTTEGFTIQITPLIRPSDIITEADLKIPSQFSDVGYHHRLNGFKTAEVTLDMNDPVVEGLEPWEFGLRILYGKRLEPIFWGPCNISDDYRTGKCILTAQDPSWKWMHHYLRRGDEAINHVPKKDKGTIALDTASITLIADAVDNTPEQDTRNDPSVGVQVFNYDFTDRGDLPIIVERGQECWQVFTNLSKHDSGPDFDMETNNTLDPPYCYIGLYADLGRDLTDVVILNYGPELTDVDVEPHRPTTHAHVLSRDAQFRRTAGSAAASNKTGPLVDWIPTDLEFPNGNDDALQARANDVVGAYAYAPKFISIKSRPDVALVDGYGLPFWVSPPDSKAATFYIGDRITVTASRGYRSHETPARITEVHLTQQGPRNLVNTELKLVPTVGDLGDDEES